MNWPPWQNHCPNTLSSRLSFKPSPCFLFSPTAQFLQIVCATASRSLYSVGLLFAPLSLNLLSSLVFTSHVFSLPYIPSASLSDTQHLIIHFPDYFLAPSKALCPCHEARNRPRFLLNKTTSFVRTTKRQSWQTTAFDFSWNEITITAF